MDDVLELAAVAEHGRAELVGRAGGEHVIERRTQLGARVSRIRIVRVVGKHVEERLPDDLISPGERGAQECIGAPDDREARSVRLNREEQRGSIREPPREVGCLP